MGLPGAGSKQLRVNIPPGVPEGRKLRLPKQAGGADLLLEIRYRAHPRYRVEGKNVHADLPVAPWEAALGARVSVPTLAGAVDLKLPAGSSSGKKLRLKGRGLPGSPAGDHYITVKIVLPASLSEEQQRLFGELAAVAEDFNPRS